jgi:hypothetical protein
MVVYTSQEGDSSVFVTERKRWKLIRSLNIKGRKEIMEGMD